MDRMIPILPIISPKSFGEHLTTTARRSKRISRIGVPSARASIGVTSKLEQSLRKAADLSASRIVAASPMILTSVQKSGIMKPSDSSPLGCESQLEGKKTSTPTKLAKRLSEELSQLSPIELKTDCTIPSPSPQPASPWNPSPNRLGRPLLSSTKLHEKLDNDRLTNAARLYEGRLRVRLNPKQEEVIQSYLLHKNADFDTFASSKCKSPATPRRKSMKRLVTPQIPPTRGKSLGAGAKPLTQPLNANQDIPLPKTKCDSKGASVGTVKGRMSIY